MVQRLTNNGCNGVRKSHKQRGLTLIELMVGIVLGLLLAIIMGGMYLSSKASFRTSGQVARIQENTRFLSYFLQRDLREANFAECGSREINNRLNISNQYFVDSDRVGVVGWEYDGSDVNETVTLTNKILTGSSTAAEVADARQANTAVASKWINRAGDPLPAIIQGFSPIAGSDIIMIAIEEKTDIRLDPSNLPSTNPLLVASGGNAIKLGHVLKVGDCRTMDKFQNTTSDGSVSIGTSGSLSGYIPGNDASSTGDWKQRWDEKAGVYIERVKVLYIGTGSGGVPALFIYDSACGLTAPPGTGCSDISNDEVVEGVENIQVLYGEDTDDDQIANSYLSADKVNDVANIVSMRVGVLMRSNTATEDVDIDTYQMVDGVTVDPVDTGLLRYVNNMTVHLRNRGL